MPSRNLIVADAFLALLWPCLVATCVARQSEAASSYIGLVSGAASAAPGAIRINEIGPGKEHAHIRALGWDDPIELRKWMSG